MNFVKTLFCGVLIVMSTPVVSMDLPKPKIDCYEIKTKEAFIGLLSHYNLLDGAFDAGKDWDQIPALLNGLWQYKVDDASKKSILDAYKRLSSPVGVLKKELAKKFATPEPPKPITLSYATQLHSWVIANKGKTLGIGIATLATIDALQAYCRTDKTTWKESDLKGKLELIRRQMIITRSYNGAYGFIKSRCA